jgi:preprotein translocase subunit YajC
MKFGTAFPMSEWVIPFVAQAAQATGEGAEGAPAPTPTGLLLEFLASPLNLILISAILFMFIVARPQQKQRKEQEQALSGLKKNDRVVTNSGIHGIVVQTNSEEGTVTIRIDENTGARMTVNRDTIANITPSDSKE